MASKIKHKMIRDREKLQKMYHQNGMSLADIAGVYGCSRQYVQMVFSALGIRRRDKRQALAISPGRRRGGSEFGSREDNFIRRNFRRMTDLQLARYLDKSRTAVAYRRLIVLGKKKLKRRNYTTKEDQYILNNYQKLSDRAMAKALKRSLISVANHRTAVLKRHKRNAGRNSSAARSKPAVWSALAERAKEN